MCVHLRCLANLDAVDRFNCNTAFSGVDKLHGGPFHQICITNQKIEV